MKIGKFKPKNKLFLAPMAGMNDIAFRLLCKKAGCGLTYTGMVNPLSKEKLILDDKPALQMFTESGRGIEEFIKKYEKKVSLFDFNLGCPAVIARRIGFGSYMTNLKKIEKFLKTMRASTSKPVTVKIRKSANMMKILKLAEKYCDAIAIHPRVKSQGYSGEPDLKTALRLKKQASIPVIYSGNVDENNAPELLSKFDAVMIGRNALGRPSIFAKLTGKTVKAEFDDYLKLAQDYGLPFKIVKIQALNFTKTRNGAKKLREKIFRAKNISDLKAILLP